MRKLFPRILREGPDGVKRRFKLFYDDEGQARAMRGHCAMRGATSNEFED